MFSSNGSFIPKQDSNARPKKKKSSYYVGVFSYISYIILFGSAIAALLVFLYSIQIQNTFAERQDTLQNIKNEFRQSELAEVQEFELLVETAETTFNESTSLAPLFSALEESVAESVQFESIGIERSGNRLTVRVNAVSDGFDTALFQRTVYERFALLESFDLQDVTFNRGVTSGTAELSPLLQGENVSFTLVAHVPYDGVPFNPRLQLDQVSQVQSETFADDQDQIDFIDSSETALTDSEEDFIQMND